MECLTIICVGVSLDVKVCDAAGEEPPIVATAVRLQIMANPSWLALCKAIADLLAKSKLEISS